MLPDVLPDDGVDDALQPEPQFVPPHVRLAVVGTGVVEVVVGTGVVEVVVGTGVVEVIFAMLHVPVKPLNTPS